jgi:hypothetical protein
MSRRPSGYVQTCPVDETRRIKAATWSLAVMVWSRRLILLVGLLFGLMAAIDPENGADRGQSLTIMLLMLAIYVIGGFQVRAHRRAMKRRE